MCASACFLVSFSSKTRVCVAPISIHGRWRSGRALCVISRTSTHVRSRNKFRRFLLVFLVFLFSFLFLSHISRIVGAKANGDADYGRREGTTLGFYSWGIKYEQSVREVKPYLLFENQCRIRERNDDNRHSRSLFQSHRYLFLSFRLLSFSFFFLFRVLLLIRTPCIAFINHSWHACVYNIVSYVHVNCNNYINESIAGRVSRGQQLDKQFSTNH